jgi:hypothetical protein
MDHCLPLALAHASRQAPPAFQCWNPPATLDALAPANGLKVTAKEPLTVTLMTLRLFSLYQRHCGQRGDAAIGRWIASFCSN